jgi:hypothetical protein
MRLSVKDCVFFFLCVAVVADSFVSLIFLKFLDPTIRTNTHTRTYTHKLCVSERERPRLGAARYWMEALR